MNTLTTSEHHVACAAHARALAAGVRRGEWTEVSTFIAKPYGHARSWNDPPG